MERELTLRKNKMGRLVFESLPSVNYAMMQNGVQACLRCIVDNQDAADWQQVVVSVGGEMVRRSEVHLDLVPRGTMVEVDSLKVEPELERIIGLTEGVKTIFTLQLSVGGEVQVQEDIDLELLPFDHWPGASIMPHLLAAFVTPNHPALSTVAVEASKFMEKWTGSPSLDAYQTQDRNRVRFQVAAVYEALRSQGIIYSEPPASFERNGQRVRLSNRVLTEKMGTCIDTTLLFASVLESIGINPVVVILRGHALVGAWLTEQFYSQDVCEDGTYLLKQSADGIHNMVLVETTSITDNHPADFEQAVDSAEQSVRDENAFVCFIDIHRCRLDGVKPLPQIVEGTDGTLSLKNETDPHEHATENIRQYDHYALHLDDNGAEVTKQTIWERKLLDFSLRNNLINCKLGRRVIPFVTFDMDKLEDNMFAGEDYIIQPYPQKALSPTENGIFDSKLQASGLRDMVGEEIRNNHHLVSYLTESDLAAALKFVYRASRNSLEENGANTLFLAMGLLKWYENEKSVVPRFAPILLMPVDIIRKSGNNYVIRTRDEDTILNITLVELLKQQFKINLTSLDVLPEDKQGVDVNLIMATVREAVKNIARWDVMEESMLGLFSFNKFVMWNDIHNNADELKKNEVVQSLMEGRVKLASADDVVDAREIDKKAQPKDFAIPVDVDSSQLEAVVESGRGRSFILYGPPGTGKSQTITNMIANALYQDKRVLFVAEKMAALEVVQKRLAKIGLDPFCLELHSNKVTKSHFLTQMQKALNVTRIKEPEDYKAMSDKLYAHRQQLIEYIEKLHKKQPSGFSLYDVISSYLSIEGDEIRRHLPSPGTLSAEKLAKWVEDIEGLDTVFQITGQPADHPLRGLQPKGFQAQTAQLIRQHLEQFKKDFAQARQKAEAMPVEISMGDKDVAWAEELHKATQQLPPQNRADFVKLSADSVQQEWQTVSDKWFLPRFFAKRSFMKKMKIFDSGASFAAVPELIDTQRQFNKIVSDYCMRHNADLAATQEKLASDDGIGKMEQLAQAIAKVRQTEGKLAEHATFDLAHESLMSGGANKQSRLATINSLADQWMGALHLIKDWTLWTDRKTALENDGLRCLTDYIETEDVTPHQAAEALKKGLYHLLTTDIVEKDPELARFNGLLFEQLVDKYKEETYLFQDLSKKELYCHLAARIPSQTMAATANSEMGILKRNIANGGRGTSIRKIIDQIPTLLPRLCPCMLMSPISVAQYIDMGGEKFDLVIFDEASQMPTSEAIGAIARGKALICVGDPKQMPPTSFFATQQVDEDEVEIDDMESILDDCITLSMPGHYLSWHYRSKHESLIAFSNLQYYEGKLHTFPSVDDRTRKVTLVQVEGTYDKGRTRSNAAEARAIVDEVLRRLQDPELSKRSIGIVSFSKVQQNLIEDILIEELAKHSDLEQKAYGCEEPIFIKNLENVQGDERDIILFSVGYGPDKQGHVSMNFGPLNNEGGERRLNVAVSRARYEMMVFATLRAEQIDLKRTQAKGVEGLKKFLEFAATGQIISAMPAQTAQQAMEKESQEHADLVSLVSEELINNGYDVQTNVGRSQFKIDIAVVSPDNPDEYILGILCDGRNYYETKTTRDREIVQPNVLTGLKWNVMRVWAVDWYERREVVMDRIMKRLDDIQNNVHLEQAPSEAVKERVSHAFAVPQEEAVPAPANDRQRSYQRAKLDTTKLKFDERNRQLYDRASERVRRLLAAEQPITNQLIYKRMAEYFGITRAGQRVQAYIDGMLRVNGWRDPLSTSDTAIWWASEEAADGFKIYRTGGERDAADIPVVEVINAVHHAIEQNIALPLDDLKRTVATLMGFTRRGAKIDALTEQAVGIMLRQGTIVDNGGRLSFK